MSWAAFWGALVGGAIAVVVQAVSLAGQNKLDARRHGRETAAANLA
jgi:hypothetical protein